MSSCVKSADLPVSVTLAFLNGLEYCNYDFKQFDGDDLATLRANLVRISPVIS